ncbi:FtsX-like permease family protein [Shewanella sp. A25]|nr:FtsX-like permease family protein [Shewanella shenzhenensis]
MLHIKPILSSLLRSKSGPLLLLMQMVLSVAIVANASFIITERLNLMARESGVEEAQVFDFTIYHFDKSTDLVAQNIRDLDILRTLPGVIDASPTSMVPLSGGGWSSNFKLSPEKDSKSSPNSAMYLGDEHFINTLGVKLIEGRNFYPQEITNEFTESGGKMLVSKALAEKIWPDESPLGKRLYMGTQQFEIIGVIERLQHAWVDNDNLEFSTVMSVDLTSEFKHYLVRAKASDIEHLKVKIPEVLHKDNQSRVIEGFKTIAERRIEAYRDHELMATVLTMMVILLLLITSLGVTGMVMFNIQRRTKQIGTRRALGAKKRDIISYFLVENYLLCLVGGTIGVLLAIQLGKQLMNFYSLPMLELSYPLLTVVGLFMVTTLAVYMPARKAAKISPATATRSV